MDDKGTVKKRGPSEQWMLCLTSRTDDRQTGKDKSVEKYRQKPVKYFKQVNPKRCQHSHTRK